MLQKRPVVSVSSLHSVFTDCLTAQKEKVLILGGADTSMISELYYHTAQSRGMDVSLVVSEEQHVLAEALESLERQSIVVCHFSRKTAIPQNMRQYCKKQKHKFILASGITSKEKIQHLLQCLSVDHTALHQKQTAIKETLRTAKELHITTPAGTDLYLDIRCANTLSSDGLYDEPGKGGNMPSGEVYVAPRKAEGTVVVDVSSKNKDGTALLNHPISLTIEKTAVTQIVDGVHGAALEQTITDAEQHEKKSSSIRKIAEFGLGLNDCASVCGITLIDEKVLGTAHIAIGSNHWFGGSNKTGIHLDQVFRNPAIEIDGEVFRYT